ncbi:tRNA pseudouridine(55) synthase TruB [Oscillospiraceae bacterium PP1C4]
MPDFNGILCIDKPQDFTSFDVVAKLRGIAQTRKIGHAGTLDPMATGVLPLFFGRATKACDILPRQDKRYLATFRLGITTDTQDITGTVTAEHAVDVTEAQVKAAAVNFTGGIMQVPPMYSAIKVNGQRLYDLARQGVEVDRQARPVTIHSLDFVSCDGQTHTYQIDVHCSKGTYIRTLVADIGDALGCGATLTALRRTMAAGFELSECITIEQAQQLAADGALESAMLPIADAFSSLPKAQLNRKQTTMFLNGVRMDPSRIPCPKTKEQMAVYSHDGIFLGIAAIVGEDFKMTKLFTLEV